MVRRLGPLKRWRQIWLNEGFATWAEWMWQEHEGGKNLEQAVRRAVSKPADNKSSGTRRRATPAAPENLFDGTIYVRGGMTLEALREEVGTQTFFRILGLDARPRLRQRRDEGVHQAGGGRQRRWTSATSSTRWLFKKRQAEELGELSAP